MWLLNLTSWQTNYLQLLHPVRLWATPVVKSGPLCRRQFQYEGVIKIHALIMYYDFGFLMFSPLSHKWIGIYFGMVRHCTEIIHCPWWRPSDALMCPYGPICYSRLQLSNKIVLNTICDTTGGVNDWLSQFCFGLSILYSEVCCFAQRLNRHLIWYVSDCLFILLGPSQYRDSI